MTPLMLPAGLMMATAMVSHGDRGGGERRGQKDERGVGSGVSRERVACNCFGREGCRMV